MVVSALVFPNTVPYVIRSIYSLCELSACSSRASVSGVNVLGRALSSLERSCIRDAGVNLRVPSVGLPSTGLSFLLTLVTPVTTLSRQTTFAPLIIQTTKVVSNSA